MVAARERVLDRRAEVPDFQGVAGVERQQRGAQLRITEGVTSQQVGGRPARAAIPDRRHAGDQHLGVQGMSKLHRAVGRQHDQPVGLDLVEMYLVGAVEQTQRASERQQLDQFTTGGRQAGEPLAEQFDQPRAGCRLDAQPAGADHAVPGRAGPADQLAQQQRVAATAFGEGRDGGGVERSAERSDE